MGSEPRSLLGGVPNDDRHCERNNSSHTYTTENFQTYGSRDHNVATSLSVVDIEENNVPHQQREKDEENHQSEEITKKEQLKKDIHGWQIALIAAAFPISYQVVLSPLGTERLGAKRPYGLQTMLFFICNSGAFIFSILTAIVMLSDTMNNEEYQLISHKTMYKIYIVFFIGTYVFASARNMTEAGCVIAIFTAISVVIFWKLIKNKVTGWFFWKLIKTKVTRWWDTIVRK